jgi:hypothetical protein
MGNRGEIFSIKTFADNGQKTYFFNIKENRAGDIFMTIAESVRRKESQTFERFQIAVFEEDFAHFAVMIWKAEELAAAGEKQWNDTLRSKNDRRFYTFKFSGGETPKRPLCLSVTEGKDGEEYNGSRVIKIYKDDLNVFSIGYNEGGNADPNRPYTPPDSCGDI